MIKEPSKTIAVDLDQTLCHTLESLVEWHNLRYSTRHSIYDFDTLDYSKVFNCSTREEMCAKIREFYNSTHFKQIQPIKDFALEALKMLKKRKFTLVIVTSRPQFVARETKQFVDKHYPGIFESIYFCNLNLSEKEQLEYISKPKSVICREIGANVLIDDCLDHALDCAQQYGHMDILLYDRNGSYKWNHTNNNSQTQLKRVFKSVIGYNYPCRNDTPYNNVQRVFSWRDIITQFPKPTSPLRNCHYPNEFILPDLVTSEEEEELEEEDELLLLEASNEHNNYFGYETVELEELTDDESPWNDSTVWM